MVGPVAEPRTAHAKLLVPNPSTDTGPVPSNRSFTSDDPERLFENMSATVEEWSGEHVGVRCVRCWISAHILPYPKQEQKRTVLSWAHNFVGLPLPPRKHVFKKTRPNHHLEQCCQTLASPLKLFAAALLEGLFAAEGRDCDSGRWSDQA